MSSDFRILILGDRHVGKTSLVNAYLKEEPLTSDVVATKDQSHLPVVSAPGALFGSTLYIVDSPRELEFSASTV